MTNAEDRRGSLDAPTVDGFGFEWTTFDQSARDEASLRASFERYFSLFPWDELRPGARGLDVGCGSGRWARLANERPVEVMVVDASAEALAVARSSDAASAIVQGSAVELPFRTRSLEFAFSLGVLHHVPDTQGALTEVHRVLRPGAPFLVYLYYAFDNRPTWFRLLWRSSDIARRAIAGLPVRIRLGVTKVIAAVVYLPLARTGRFLARRGRRVDSLPLSAYRDQPFYVMQTDALDRFGTRLEKRYTRAEITQMLETAGFGEVTFREDWPYWCAVARA